MRSRQATPGARLALLLAALAASGCGAHTLNANFTPEYHVPGPRRFEIGSVTNQTGQINDVDVESMFRSALSRELSANGLLEAEQTSDRLVLESQILEYSKGDAFKRWLLPGWGSTILRVHCEIKKAESGDVAGSVDARRTVSFGGLYTVNAWQTIFNALAKDVAAKLQEGGDRSAANAPK